MGRLKGSKLSDEHKLKLSESHKGKIFSEITKDKMKKSAHRGNDNASKRPEVRQKIREALIGKKKSDEHRKKIGLSGLGRIISIQTRKKMSENRKGEKNPRWLGGLSKNPYPFEFNSKLKNKIRKRDNFTCCLCSRTEREELEELNRVLCVNHIDFDKNNCKENNLNTLCVRCNVKINRERVYWTNHFQTLT